MQLIRPEARSDRARRARPSARQNWVIPALVLLVFLAMGLSLFVGSMPIDWQELITTLRTGEPSVSHTVVFDLRLPRALSALVVGASLSLAGVLMQVLLRNPLADPYVLGTSGGAAAFVLLVIFLGLPHQSVPLAAGIGSVLSMGLLFMLARGEGDWSSARLLLTGIVLASGWGALISFILSITQGAEIHSMLFWLMGDFRAAPPGGARWLLLLAALALSLVVARDLNLLAGGELRAQSLGVPTLILRLGILFGASLLTAAAVTLSGSIGFVGLVVPHMMRRLVGSDHRRLVPASALAGSCLLVLAEMIARTVLAPQQLPVGVITAFVGVPLFLYLLRRGHQTGSS